MPSQAALSQAMAILLASIMPPKKPDLYVGTIDDETGGLT